VSSSPCSIRDLFGSGLGGLTRVGHNCDMVNTDSRYEKDRNTTAWQVERLVRCFKFECIPKL
jgi:hypothetical protein